ncbi:MAG: hypothetical protein Q4C13_01175 [Clostridia bacterium]|nr:hypothetical protein [Clostridia bacterium]
MMKLTRREKTMIYILALVLAAAAAWFLVRPALDASSELEARIAEAALEKASVEQVIATRPAYVEAIAEAEARGEALEDEFLPYMTNDDLDRYITGLLQRNGLVAESLQIRASADGAGSAAVTRLSVEVTARGGLSRFMALVDQVSGLRGIRIAEMVVRQERELTETVPLTEEEIQELEAQAAVAGKRFRRDEETLTKEITVMEYGMEIRFEAAEFDAALFRILSGGAEG